MQPLMFAKMGDTLYMADAQGRVLQLGGTTHDGAAINWEWESKPFGARSMGQFIRWRGLWVTVDKPAGSEINLYINDKPTGNDGWKLAGTLNAAADLRTTRVPIPPATMGNAQFLRHKLVGSGPATVHEIAWDQVELPLV